MKIKNKGKVYPSPSSSSSSTSCGDDYLSVLKLLPAAILVLVSVLSLEDREVLAYLITKSLNTTTTAGVSGGRVKSPVNNNNKKKVSKKQETHKPPVFDCDCFDCYTSYWLRWDSSPNRELIHQAIEAFEDHLTSGERKKTKKGKKREKTGGGRRVVEKPVDESGRPETGLLEGPSASVLEQLPPPPPPQEPPVSVADDAEVLSEGHVSPGREADEGETQKEDGEEGVMDAPPVVVRSPAENGHKGLARKVLPDVLGLFNSRLWSLWNPNA